jgi:hypothetical protein
MGSALTSPETVGCESQVDAKVEDEMSSSVSVTPHCSLLA